MTLELECFKFLKITQTKKNIFQKINRLSLSLFVKYNIGVKTINMIKLEIPLQNNNTWDNKNLFVNNILFRPNKIYFWIFFVQN